MKIAVTGGAGFIGAAVCGDLAAATPVTEVAVIDDLSTGDSRNIEGVPGVRLIPGSILDNDVLHEGLTGASSVIHLAGRASVEMSTRDPVTVHEINATGTLRVLEAARCLGIRHVVVASSSAVYGPDPGVPTPESLPAAPASPYAASKLAAESYALAYARSFGLDILPLRFFNVFGPRQDPSHAYAAVIPAFISAALAGQPLRILGDGQQTRDFIFVGSVARILTDAVARRVASDEPVNVAAGTRTSLLQLVDVLGELVGRPLPVEYGPARTGDVRHSQADVSRLHALFGAGASAGLRSGLSQTLEWFRTAGSARAVT